MNHAWISDAPRLELGFLPTPLVPLERLSARLGGPRLWLKRDDCTGLATGGNKTRKLEYLLADAIRQQADAIVTFGAVQSNHARQTAAACAAAGMPCHLVLARKVPWPHPHYDTSGNVLLDRLLGADVQVVAPDAFADARAALLDRLERDGRLPYVIPVGGSSHVGAMGYARCAMELMEQSRALEFALTDVVHASSSAGTQAGLLAGFAGLVLDGDGTAPRVHGINVSEVDPTVLPKDVQRLVGEVIAERGLDAAVAAEDVRLDDRYLGDGYGLPTEATVAAIRLLAGTEGVLLDPVYSGKAFAALVDRIERGEFAGVDDVVFIHTGGTASLAVYDTAFI
ncbi:MAG: D-cysteine desulfhydrase [Gammaproteobacteria bacterium]|nr:D-cysteine desulfhydrase [Gammaproteobacteria bacterium]